VNTKTTRRALLGTAAAGAGAAWWFRPRRADWSGPPPFLTPQAEFYDRFSAKAEDGLLKQLAMLRSRERQEVPTAPWKLTIEGRVRRTFVLDESILDAMTRDLPQVSYLKTLRCTGDQPGNRLSSTGLWTGIPLKRLLDHAGLLSDARRLRVFAQDGFTNNLRLAELGGTDRRPTLLATRLNGEPLLPERGHPARLIVPDRFGFKNLKWPERIVVTPNDAAWGNHEVDTSGGRDDGLLSMSVKILSPDIRHRTPEAWGLAGRRRIEGIAQAGLVPVGVVEVRLNDGEWQRAALTPPVELTSEPVASAPGLLGRGWPRVDVWTPWSIELDLPPGDHVVAARVLGQRGELQPELDPLRIDGDSSWAKALLHMS